MEAKPFWLFVCLMLLLASHDARAQDQPGPGRHGRVEGELLVKFRGGTRGPAAERTRRDLKHNTGKNFERIGWQRIQIARGLSIDEALQRYRQHPDVLAVEANTVARAIPDLPEFAAASAASAPGDGTPGDPQLASQWALAKINAPVAWLNQIGSPEVVVAVIDSGVNYLHEDLAANMWRNPGEIPGNGVDDDGNGWIDDVFGIDTANDSNGNDSDPFDHGLSGYYYHGTLAAGIIGAIGNNQLGIAGVNWSVRIMAVRAIRSSNFISLSDELEALEYVLAMKNRGVNIRAVNMSYGGMPYSLAQRDAHAALADAGILLCAAAGNTGTNNDATPSYPASHPLPGIISVAASDEADQLATFPTGKTSHYGRTSVDLAAPGLHVASTFGLETNSYYTDFWGTSAATPHVAGAVALLAAANPLASPQQIKTALLESVDVRPAFTNKMVSHGRLNLGRAIDHPLIANGPPTIAQQPLAQTVVLSNQVTFTAIAFGEKPRSSQWLFNGEPISGATNITLTLAKPSFADTGLYSVAVSNILGLVISKPASLTIDPLKIVTQSESQLVRVDATARFDVSALSPLPITYQWRLNGTNLAAATNTSLRITKTQLAHEGLYSVAVSNRFGGEISDDARLTVLMNPAITSPPVSQSIVQGGNATFSVGFTGSPSPFGVQWQQGSTKLASNTVAGIQDFFTLTNAQPAQAGTWRVRVRNLASNTGAQKTFSLTILPDSDGDGLPNAWELAHGFATNNPTDALMDHDGDGVINRDEYIAGTNPTNALNFPRIEAIQQTNVTTSIQFIAVSNRTYSLLRSARAEAEPWQRVADILAATTNRTMTILDPTASFQEPLGVRPSPGAETSELPERSDRRPTPGATNLAAPEDGRTPVQRFKASNSAPRDPLSESSRYYRLVTPRLATDPP